MLRKFSLGFGLIALLALAACGDRKAPDAVPPLPDGKPIDTPAFQSRKLAETGQNRIRLTKPTTAADRRALAAIDGPGNTPAGYLNMIDQALMPNDHMQIDVIAEVDTASGKAKRLIRLTADQSAFVNQNGGQMIETKGQYYFRGQSFAWVTIDDRPLLSGAHVQGLENMMIDFDRQTASIDLRTEVAGASEVEVQIRAKDLPFNIRSGAFGGDINIALRDPNSPKLGEVPGSIRGNIGGTPGYVNGKHDLTTSGVFTGKGQISDPSGLVKGPSDVTIDGIFFGKDVNAAR